MYIKLQTSCVWLLLFRDVHTFWHSVANNVLRLPHKMSRSIIRIFEAAEVIYKCTAANWVPIGSLFSLSWIFNLDGSSVSASWIQNLYNDPMLKIFLEVIGIEMANCWSETSQCWNLINS